MSLDSSLTPATEATVASIDAKTVTYTEGATDASITGTAMLWEDAADTLRAVSATKPLPSEIFASGTAVTGTLFGSPHYGLDVVILDENGNPNGSTAPLFVTSTTMALDATITARLGVLGQAAMAASAPVVIANNQSAIPVSQSGSWSLAANQSVNVAQMNGVATTMGNGASGTGVQRVTIASDSTGVVGLATGSNTIGSLTANQSVNLTQLSGNAIAAGNGTVGVNVQRVTIASDSTGQIIAKGAAANAAAPVGNPVLVAGWDGVNVRIPGVNSLGQVSITGVVQGDVAHDTADSGNPVKIGFKAVSHGASPTAVTANDRVNAIANEHGVPFVIGGHPFSVCTRFTYTGAQTNVAMVSAGASERLIITALEVTQGATNTNYSQARIGFGATTTPTGAGTLLSHAAMVPGQVYSRGDGGGILGAATTLGDDLRITATDPGGTLDVMITYYIVTQ